MLHTLIHYRAHMTVRQGIYNAFSLPAGAYQLKVFKHLKLMRYRRNPHVEQLCNVADAHFGLKQHIKYLYSRAVPEHLVQLSQVAYKILIGHGLAHRIHYVLMYTVNLAALLSHFYHSFIRSFFHLNIRSSVIICNPIKMSTVFYIFAVYFSP